MKKYIFTESQIKKIIDSTIMEQPSVDFNSIYNNPPISEQKKKFPNAKFGFTDKMLKQLDNDGANKLYQVKPGDTISGIVEKLGANSEYSILYSNDVLNGNPKKLQAGMVIVYNKRPSR